VEAFVWKNFVAFKYNRSILKRLKEEKGGRLVKQRRLLSKGKSIVFVEKRCKKK